MKDKGYKISCSHKSESSYCKKDQVLENDVQMFHDKFWSIGNAVKERMYLQKNMIVKSVSRKNKTGSSGNIRTREWSTNYTIPTNGGTVKICKETFMSSLSVGRARVEKTSRDSLLHNQMRWWKKPEVQWR